MSEASAHTNIYTEEDYYSLPEHVREELIDGRFYLQAAPGNPGHDYVRMDLRTGRENS